MKSILLALPRAQAASQMKKVLLNASFSVAGVYSSGAEVLTAVSALPNGVVICARLPDLSPAQLAQMLPDGFDLIELVSSGQIPVQGYSNVVSLHLPLNRLVLTLEMPASANGGTLSGGTPATTRVLLFSRKSAAPHLHSNHAR